MRGPDAVGPDELRKPPGAGTMASGRLRAIIARAIARRAAHCSGPARYWRSASGLRSAQRCGPEGIGRHRLAANDAGRGARPAPAAITGSISAFGISSSGGIGLATSWPPGRPRRAGACASRAAMAAASSSRSGAGEPASRATRTPGTLSCPKAMTGTPRVSSTSRVFGNVEDRLGAGADHGHRGLRQFRQVGGDVEAAFGAAMHAADAAGGEAARSRQGAPGSSSPRRWSTPVAPGRQRHGQIGARQLEHAGGPRQCLQFRPGQSDMHPARDHRDGGGHRAGRAHLGLDRAARCRGSAANGIPWVMIVDSSATSGRRVRTASTTSAERNRGTVTTAGLRK